MVRIEVGMNEKTPVDANYQPVRARGRRDCWMRCSLYLFREILPLEMKNFLLFFPFSHVCLSESFVRNTMRHTLSRVRIWHATEGDHGPFRAMNFRIVQ